MIADLKRVTTLRDPAWTATERERTERRACDWCRGRERTTWHSERLRGTVQGSRSRPYDVRVTLSAGRYVDGRCDCPDDAVPCKHVVAAVLASEGVAAVGADRSLEALLESASAEELRELCRSLADEDFAVRKRLYEELDDSQHEERS